MEVKVPAAGGSAPGPTATYYWVTYASVGYPGRHEWHGEHRPAGARSRGERLGGRLGRRPGGQAAPARLAPPRYDAPGPDRGRRPGRPGPERQRADGRGRLRPDSGPPLR